MNSTKPPVADNAHRSPVSPENCQVSTGYFTGSGGIICPIIAASWIDGYKYELLAIQDTLDIIAGKWNMQVMALVCSGEFRYRVAGRFTQNHPKNAESGAERSGAEPVDCTT